MTVFFSICIHAALLVFLAVTTISGAAQNEKEPELPMTLSLFNFVEEKPPAPAAAPKQPAKPPQPQPVADETVAENFIAAEELPEAAVSDAVDEGAENAAAGNAPVSSAALESGSKQTGEYVQKNYRYIQRRIQDCLTYPAQARRAGIQGTAEIIFTIGQDGSVSGLAVRRSSGEAMLDEAALEAVRKAAPFSPPPAPARIAIPVAFNIR